MVRAFLDSVAETAAEPDQLEVVLYIDDDDVTSTSITHPRLRLTRIIGPPVTMGAANSACLARAAGTILMLANDDVIAATPGWDAEVRRCHANCSDGIYLAWANDRFASYRMSTFPILSRTACDLLVEPYPAEYRSAFIDYELFDIFTRLRRLGHDRLVYLKHVVLEHRHHRTGKRLRDDTSRRHRRFEDDLTFFARRESRQRQAERLVAAVEGGLVPPRVLATRKVAPRNVAEAVIEFGRGFLGDSGLPLRRRAYLLIWYCGRYAAARLAA